MTRTTLTHKLVRGSHLLVIAALLAGLALGLAPPAARAATFDIADGDVTALINAITTANGNAEADTINLAADGTYTLTEAPGAHDADGPNGLPSVTTDITINGNGATIQRSGAGGTPDFRILHVGTGGDLTLNDVTIANGKTPDGSRDGGGIYNLGTLTLANSSVSGNSTGNGAVSGGSGGEGGGICNLGTLDIVDSSVSGNWTGDGSACDGYGCSGGDGGYGGGIFNYGGGIFDYGGGGIFSYNGGIVQITGSSVSGNWTGDGAACSGDNCVGGDGGAGGGICNLGTLDFMGSTVSGNWTGDGGACTGGGCGGGAGGDGGGLLVSSSSPTLTNVTISGNEAAGDGGGIYRTGSGALQLTNCTITGNRADSNSDGDGDGGGIYRDSGTVNLKNTILAGNADPTSAPECSGTLTSQDYNLVGDDTGCTFTAQTNDQVGTCGSPIDPQLGPLADNGGPTETHALLAGSPALDAIPEAAGGDYNGAPGTDQRGVTRPQGDNCDIGAFEAVPLVGGIVVPVDRLGLLAPWLGLTMLASLAALTVALTRRRGA